MYRDLKANLTVNQLLQFRKSDLCILSSAELIRLVQMMQVRMKERSSSNYKERDTAPNKVMNLTRIPRLKTDENRVSLECPTDTRKVAIQGGFLTRVMNANLLSKRTGNPFVLSQSTKDLLFLRVKSSVSALFTTPLACIEGRPDLLSVYPHDAIGFSVRKEQLLKECARKFEQLYQKHGGSLIERIVSSRKQCDSHYTRSFNSIEDHVASAVSSRINQEFTEATPQKPYLSGLNGSSLRKNFWLLTREAAILVESSPPHQYSRRLGFF